MIRILACLYTVAMLIAGESELVYMGEKCDIKIKIVRSSEIVLINTIMLLMLSAGGRKVYQYIICACFILLTGLFAKELSFWWLNMRKFLFFNKVVNPFNTDYLITFDAKNEELKYFGTLREMDKTRFGKWAVYLLITPISLVAYVGMTLLSFLLTAISSATILNTMYIVTIVYMTVFCVSVWYTGYRASKQFYRKSKKKSQ